MFTCGRWRPISPLSGPRTGACSAIVEDEDGQPEMWVMSGYDGENFLATVEAYNPRTNTWRSCLPLSQRREYAVAGVVGGRLVVAGGFFGGSLTSVEAYTPTGWTPLPPMPHHAYAATACVLNGRLFVAGGVDSDRLLMWDTKKWTLKAPMPAERFDAASVVHEGKMMVVGGRVRGEGCTASVILYNPQTDTWADGPPLPSPRAACRAVEHAGAIILVGCGPTLRFEDGRWVALRGIPEGREPAFAATGSIFLG